MIDDVLYTKLLGSFTSPIACAQVTSILISVKFLKLGGDTVGNFVGADGSGYDSELYDRTRRFDLREGCGCRFDHTSNSCIQ